MLDMHATQPDAQMIVVPREVEFKGEKLKVPDAFWDADNNGPNVGALVKSHADLRRKLSDQGPGSVEPMSVAPDNYELVVPEHLAEMIKADGEDPLAKSAMDWARKHGLGQDAFSELTAMYYDKIAPQPENNRREGEMEKLHNSLGPRAEDDMKNLSRWVDGLLGDDLSNAPELYLALDHLTATADGVMLLKVLKDRLTERGVPTARHNASRGMNAEALRELQASAAYASGDPAVRRKVAQGWAQLYPIAPDEI